MQHTKIKKEIKSPLRYPGGKSRAIKNILPLIPDLKEFREPFVGGGSVFFALKQRIRKPTEFIINDLNNDLYLFWKIARDQNLELVSKVQEIKNESKDGKKLFISLKNSNGLDELEKAARFFVMNRITFSGLSDSGGFSELAFQKRFTQSSIDRISLIENLLAGSIIKNNDYQNIIEDKGDNVFIFLDPPYWKSAKKRLYGKKGDLHLTFDHKRFAKVMSKCEHKWLITYDDCEAIRRLFNFANIYEWELQYGMNNFKQNKANKGKELFITNYEISSGEIKENQKSLKGIMDYVPIESTIH